ncbi:TPA: hypothetical protein ACX6NV_000581 [Photobacterium damselae]
MEQITNKTENEFWVYWRTLTKQQKHQLAESVNSSVNTLRQIPNCPISTKLAMRIEKATGVSKSNLRPDIWPV